MYGLTIRAAACVLALLLFSSPARAFDLPYEMLAGTSMPDTEAWEDPQVSGEIFPDWNESLLQGLGYREQRTYYHGTRGVVTASLREAAWLSLIYYGPDGNCWLTLPAGRLEKRQQVSFSEVLNSEEQGLTRVLLWSHEPSRDRLREIAREATPALSQPGVLYQAWFPRTNMNETGLPWEPTQFRVYATPPSFAMTDIPSARIQLSQDYVVFSKDCSVDFRGRYNLGSDEWGSRSEWVVSWGSPLRMEVYLPEKYYFTNALLRLYIEPDSPYGDSPGSSVLLKVNGRDVHNLQGDSILIGAKHVDYELGQYMYPGLNVLELSLDAFSTRDWLLQTAEVWVR